MPAPTHLSTHFLLSRPRRNRKNAAIRQLVQENMLTASDLILPLFIKDANDAKEPIGSMPDVYRLGQNQLFEQVETCLKLGVQAVVLFPVVTDNLKDKKATYSWQDDNFYVKTIAAVKSRFPEIAIITDVAMDPYSSDGHDGLVEAGEIVNDATLEILGRMALVQAQAGADMLGPSDMMDGRVAHIRHVLDNAGYSNTGIMSYTAKYASAFYGPFRDALDSAPKFGDKKTYQMNPANALEALREADADTAEGADILMVKPAGMYLDIIHLLKNNSRLPIAAYQVSGEYAMIKAAASQGWIDHDRAMLESLLCIKRAGASMILTYFASHCAAALQRV